MLNQVGRLYSRASKLLKLDEPRDFAREVLAAFWVQQKWNEAVPSDEAFRQVPAKRFDADVELLIRAWEMGKALPQLNQSTPDEIFYAFAVLARALDRALLELAELMATPISNFQGGSDDFVRIDHGLPFVGPYFSVLRRSSRWERKRTVIGRAPTGVVVLQNHVIFPSELFGYSIRLRREGNDNRLSELFPETSERVARGYLGAYGEVRKFPQEDGRYRGFCESEGIDEKKRAEEVRGHIAEAKRQGANITILPELTVSRGIVDRLKLDLSKGELARPDLAGLVLPGTYHATLNGKKRNRAELIGPAGHSILTQDKARPYVDDTFTEDIQRSDELNILVSPIGPMMIAICRDFCDCADTAKDVLDVLPLKNILVPSMGGAETSGLHKKRLEGAASVQEWRVLIAQQRLQPDESNFLFGRCPACKGRPEPPEKGPFFVKNLL